MVPLKKEDESAHGSVTQQGSVVTRITAGGANTGSGALIPSPVTARRFDLIGFINVSFFQKSFRVDLRLFFIPDDFLCGQVIFLAPFQRDRLGKSPQADLGSFQVYKKRDRPVELSANGPDVFDELAEPPVVSMGEIQAAHVHPAFRQFLDDVL